MPSEFGELFKERLKKKKEELEEISGSSIFLSQLSEEMESEIESNPILKFKKTLSETRKKVKGSASETFNKDIFEGRFIGPEEIINENNEVIAEILIEAEPIQIESNEKAETLIRKDLISASVESISKEESLKQDPVIENITNLFSNPNSKKADPNIKAIQNKLKLLEDWVAKISMAGPGGGEVNFRYLDDVDPSTVEQNKFLTFNPVTQYFDFEYVTSTAVINKTKTVTDDYVFLDDDYYVGVNCSNSCTITLPTIANNGRTIIIKDESGNCSNNSITALGTVDNDSGGFIMEIDNASIQLIYNNGWKII